MRDDRDVLTRRFFLLASRCVDRVFGCRRGTGTRLGLASCGNAIVWVIPGRRTVLFFSC